MYAARVKSQHDEKWYTIADSDGWTTGSIGIENYPRLFDSEAAANEFIDKWLGHPWWVKGPFKERDVYLVKPRMVQQGWERC